MDPFVNLAPVLAYVHPLSLWSSDMRGNVMVQAFFSSFTIQNVRVQIFRDLACAHLPQQ
jgi:hypothetical protein